MPEPEAVDLTDSERMAISAVDRFETLIRELDDVANTLKANLVRGHELLADLASRYREAADATKRLARDEVRKALAKEAQQMAGPDPDRDQAGPEDVESEYARGR